MSVLANITCVVGIVFMLTFIFIGIWSFILAIKSLQQLKYKNYILQKIYMAIERRNDSGFENINDNLNDVIINSESNDKTEDLSEFDNVTDFDKNDKKDASI